MLSTYAFYRACFPDEEDKKTYKLLWALQMKAPVIEGHTHTFCYVYKFLLEVCPLKSKTSLEPRDPN